MGLEPPRVRLEWISAAEGDKVRSVVDDMVAQLRALGPLDLPGRFNDWDRELAGDDAGEQQRVPLAHGPEARATAAVESSQ
jgi:hypothetical protein